MPRIKVPANVVTDEGLCPGSQMMPSYYIFTYRKGRRFSGDPFVKTLIPSTKTLLS
jgi:hypothetical protein